MKTKYQRVTRCFKQLFAVFCFLLLTVHCSLFAVRANSVSSEQRLEVFDQVWQTIGERYYDANLRGVDWLAQREIYRQQAANAQNATEFYQVLRKMVGTLHDSHTRVYAPEERSDWRNPRFVGVGVWVREIENQIVVVKVDKNAVGKAQIKVGDVVTAVDGAPIQAVLVKRIVEQTGASTAAAARLKAAAGIFEGAADSTVKLNLRDEKGRERQVQLARQWRNLPATLNARRVGSTLIVSFDAFAPEIVREFYQMLNADLRGARSIVLDLRGNRGGSAEAMTDIASAFLPRQQMLGKFVDRQGKTIFDVQTRQWLFYTASSVRVPKLPIVVLTGTATASAAEIFANALKQTGRARVVGATTCGCVLAVKGQHSLPDGGALEISEYDFQLADGARLEGIGLQPDETVLPTRKDLIEKRDRALERALTLLK